jgi:hypothetical protein
MPTPGVKKASVFGGLPKVNMFKPRETALWKGPEDAGPLGGVTFSALSRFLVCRERFRLEMIEGIKARRDFNPRIEFGSMWHECERALEAGKDPKNKIDQWKYLGDYARDLANEHPHCADQIRHWYNVIKTQFPLYVDYWRKHPETDKTTPIFQEQVFHIPYTLPSGRIIYLRGKWDSVDFIASGENKGIWVMENKTKSEINRQEIERQLRFDLQTLLYIVALQGAQVSEVVEKKKRFETNGFRAVPGLVQLLKLSDPSKIAGVRYNVVRRPLSGGKGNIVRHKGSEGSKCSKCDGACKVTPKVGPQKGQTIRCDKCNGAGRTGGKPPETDYEFYGRVAKYITDEPETYFDRWRVPISASDVERFQHRCLNPLLQQLCDWYKFVTSGDPWRSINLHGLDLGTPGIHWQHPFGVYNALNEGGSSHLDDYIMGGSELGLERIDSLFTELKG